MWHECVPCVATLNIRKTVWIYCRGHPEVPGNDRDDSQDSRTYITETRIMGATEKIREMNGSLVRGDGR